MLALDLIAHPQEGIGDLDVVVEFSGQNSHHRDSIVVKDCGNIFGREFVGGVGDQ